METIVIALNENVSKKYAYFFFLYAGFVQRLVITFYSFYLFVYTSHKIQKV